MKTITKLITIFAVIFTFNSCEDAIDIRQPGVLFEDKAFENLNDLELGLRYVYGAVSNNTQIALSSIWTDEVGIGFANGGQGLGGEYLFVMNSGSFQASGIWESNYDLINFANRLIRASETIQIEEGQEADVANVVAQARALRAYGHFQLLTYFSTDLTDDSALGTILVDFVPETDQELPRSTNGEVFALINDDLEFAEANITNTSDATYLTPNAITAMRARMALYRENYTQAEQYADELIASSSLSQPQEYKAIWEDQAVGEVIFKLERTTGDSRVGRLFHSIDNTINGSPFYELGRALFNELDQNDVRYDVLVHPSSEIDPDYQESEDYRNSDILVINKYPGSEQNSLNDIKIFRLSEMYFIKAEARINAGDLEGAAQQLDILRNVRYESNPPQLDS